MAAVVPPWMIIGYHGEGSLCGMATMRKVKVSIAGTDYTIASDEEEVYVRELAAEVDREMQHMLEAGARVSTTMAAVLTAITSADKARKATETADNLRMQMKDYLDDNARVRAEAEAARRECANLRRELQELRQRHPGGQNRGNG